MIAVSAVEYFLKQYGLQQGALEIQYIEEFFLDFPRKKTANEVIKRLSDRDHQILMAEAPLPDDPGTVTEPCRTVTLLTSPAGPAGPAAPAGPAGPAGP